MTTVEKPSARAALKKVILEKLARVEHQPPRSPNASGVGDAGAPDVPHDAPMGKGEQAASAVYPDMPRQVAEAMDAVWDAASREAKEQLREQARTQAKDATREPAKDARNTDTEALQSALKAAAHKSATMQQLVVTLQRQLKVNEQEKSVAQLELKSALERSRRLEKALTESSGRVGALSESLAELTARHAEVKRRHEEDLARLTQVHTGELARMDEAFLLRRELLMKELQASEDYFESCSKRQLDEFNWRNAKLLREVERLKVERNAYREALGTELLIPDDEPLEPVLRVERVEPRPETTSFRLAHR